MASSSAEARRTVRLRLRVVIIIVIPSTARPLSVMRVSLATFRFYCQTVLNWLFLIFCSSAALCASVCSVVACHVPMMTTPSAHRSATWRLTADASSLDNERLSTILASVNILFRASGPYAVISPHARPSVSSSASDSESWSRACALCRFPRVDGGLDRPCPAEFVAEDAPNLISRRDDVVFRSVILRWVAKTYISRV